VYFDRGCFVHQKGRYMQKQNGSAKKSREGRSGRRLSDFREILVEDTKDTTAKVVDLSGKPHTENNKPEPLVFSSCIHCGGGITYGYYGRHGNGGTCCKSCETLYTSKVRGGELASLS
jgi:hypothetical protein